MFSNFLAPIHDYSNLPFRLLCQRYGADALCVPLISATAIARDSSMLSLIDANPDEKGIGVQLVSDNPGHIGNAAKKIVDAMHFVSWLNLNCGCPSTRTTTNGGGSAMLEHPQKIVEAVEMMRKTDILVSVKIRINRNLDETVSLCQSLGTAGADFIIIHARRPEQGYSGKADWGLIKSLRKRLDIPVVGNGDITSAEEGRMLVKEGFCDSFMIARAAMGNPLLFSDKRPEGLSHRVRLLEDYVSLYERYIGKAQTGDAKLKAVNFISGVPDATAIRDRICRAGTCEEILRYLAGRTDTE